MLSKNLKYERIKKGKKRLCIYKSNQHLYAQIIDDQSGSVVCSASTLSEKKSKNLNNSHLIGEVLGKKALSLKVTDVYFDRNGSKFHGNVKAIAEGARKAGLNF